VILDEPNASLDIEGDDALNQAIAAMKEKGTTVIVIGHRPSTLSQVERILFLRDGRVAMFGPRADVIEALKRQRVQPINPQQANPQQTNPQQINAQQRSAQPARIAPSETTEYQRDRP
jgi:ABC-type protease/lipase transport system fused ATPase/permease subunit